MKIKTFLFILLLFFSMFQIGINADIKTAIDISQYATLIKLDSDLTFFDLHFKIQENAITSKVGAIGKNDLSFDVLNSNANFTSRLRSYDFNITNRNGYYFIDLHIDCLASDKPFNVDIVPRIKTLTVNKFAWWNSSFKKLNVITINKVFIQNKLGNFPILLKINSTIGAKCDGGKSIRFTSIDNTTMYYYEVEKWNSSGTSYIWIKIPSVNSSAMAYSTRFNFYYNNSGALPTGYNDSDFVWDNNFIAVWHMQNYGTTQILDSTKNHFTLTKYAQDKPRNLDSIAGYGQRFNGADANMTYSSSTAGRNAFGWLSGQNNTAGFTYTLESWIAMGIAEPGISYPIITTEGDFASVNIGNSWLYDDRVPDKNRKLDVFIGKGSAGNPVIDYKTSDFAYNNTIAFTHIYSTWDQSLATVNSKQYMNRSLIGSGSKTANVPVATKSKLPLTFGDMPGLGWNSYYTLDEFRISNVVRNTSWMNATYYSMARYSSFIVWGLTIEYSIPDTECPAIGTQNFNNLTYNYRFEVYLSDNLHNFQYNISCNNSQFTTATGCANGTYHLDLVNLLFNVTYTINVSLYDNICYTNQSYTLCYSGISVGDEMEITLGIGLLGILLTLVIFGFVLFSDKRTLFKPALMFFNTPLCLAVGIYYLNNVALSLTWWIGILWICFCVLQCFGGFYYSMNYGSDK